MNKITVEDILKLVQYADLIRMNPQLAQLLLDAGWEKFRKH